MVLELGAPNGSPMTGTMTALHIVGAAFFGGASVASLISLWGINGASRDKNKGNISMKHTTEGAPLFGGFVGFAILMLVYLFSYVIDGTAMTIFNHEPPTFKAAGGALVWSYEIFIFAMHLAAYVVPLVVNGYRHGLTPGFMIGIAAVGTANSAVSTFCHFQMKSDVFYGMSYTATIIIGLATYAIVASYSNITTKSSYERAGTCTLLSIGGYVVFMVLEMCFAFWFNLWTQQSSIALEFAVSSVICGGVTIFAMASEYSTLEQLLSRGKSVISKVGDMGPMGSI